MQYLIYFGMWNDSICSPSAQLCIAEEWWMLITGKTICSRTADRLRWTTFNVFISSASRCWYLWFTVQQDETTKPYWQNVISNQRIMDGVIFFPLIPLLTTTPVTHVKKKLVRARKKTGFICKSAHQHLHRRSHRPTLLLSSIPRTFPTVAIPIPSSTPRLQFKVFLRGWKIDCFLAIYDIVDQSLY